MAARTYDLTQQEIEYWLVDAESGMENALKAKSQRRCRTVERPNSDLKESYGESMLEIKFRVKLQSHLDSNDD